MNEKKKVAEDMTQEGAEVMETSNVEEMSDEEFLNYLEDITEGGAPEEEALTPEEDPEIEEPIPPEEKKLSEDEGTKAAEKNNLGAENKTPAINPELEGMLEIARDVYNTDNDAELIERMKQDILSAGATAAGADPEEYKGNLEQKKKADKYDKMMQEENEKKNIVDTWTKDAERIKEDFPDFDLETALSDPAFRDSLVNKQRSVAESLLAMMKQAAAKKVTPERNISQNASRNPGNSTVKKDPSKMSDDEFSKYIKKIKGN
jgi:hypothetical protein